MPLTQLVLTIGTFAVAIFSAAAGMLGENLILPASITADIWGFCAINVSVVAVCILTFRWCQERILNVK